VVRNGSVLIGQLAREIQHHSTEAVCNRFLYLKNIFVDLSPPENSIRAPDSPTCCTMASAITSIRLEAIDIVRENGLYAGIAAVVLITMILSWVSGFVDGMRGQIHVNAT
jgi:hypothetical protein